MEYFELLDERGEKLGKRKEREAVHRDGDLHGASHIWVIRLCPQARVEVLLQRRRPDKDSFPNCLDVSCAGHMTAGETFLSTALRELKEELNLSAREEDLIYLHDQRVGGDYVFHGRPFRNYEVNCVYLLRPDFPLSDLRGQKEEISGLEWHALAKLRREMTERSSDYCIWPEEFGHLWEYCRGRGWEEP